MCGKYCEECPEVRRGCRGCAYQLGLPPAGECPVFRCCAVERGLEHCGLCADFPCLVFLEIDSPLEGGKRYRALTRRAELGTDAWLEEKLGGEEES